MRLLPLALLAFVLIGCTPFASADDDFRVPLVCGPSHKRLPCGPGAEVRVSYRFNLLTHCGVEWAYFDGRYWVPRPKVDAPSHWANIEAGTIVLKGGRVAVFEADDGGLARFAPARSGYDPPACA